MKTMTFHTATVNDLRTAIASEDFAIEPKLDGIRAMAVIDDGKVQLLNRHGKVLASSQVNWCRGSIEAKLERDFPSGYWILDGEIMPADGTFWVFDLVQAPGVCNEDYAFRYRRDALEHLAELLAWENDPKPIIHIVSHAVSEAGKGALVAMIMADGGEGVMIKSLKSPYAGRRVRHSLKWKITKTADVVVTARNTDGKCNASLGVFDSGKLVNVGDVSMIGRPDVPVGTVLEVKFLYVTEGTRLYQPRVVGVRYDKTGGECEMHQLTDLVVNKVTATKADAA
jgi:ATP-dependent DNA ligase